MITTNINPHYKLIILSSVILLIMIIPPTTVTATDCSCQDLSQPDRPAARNKTTTSGALIKFKLAAITSVLAAGAIGVSLPILGRKLPVLRPENDMFFMIKAFAAGVILSTGFVHILPDAFNALKSPCLLINGDHQNPWGEFPLVGFVAMLAAIGTLMVDTFATSFYKNVHADNKAKQVNYVVDDQEAADHHAHVHVHTHGHGHGHGAAVPSHDDDMSSISDLVRQRIISQVLEVGIVVHSVIIGISVGASQSLDTIKPLLAALSFHQFFEGMGLGGCISQAKFKCLTRTIMMLFFSVTTPIGIGVGMGIWSVYNKENSSKSVIVEGILNSASGGILIYMALVDLLAADFMSPRMQSNVRLQMGAHTSLLLGAASMSFLAKWA